MSVRYCILSGHILEINQTLREASAVALFGHFLHTFFSLTSVCGHCGIARPATENVAWESRRQRIWVMTPFAEYCYLYLACVWVRGGGGLFECVENNCCELFKDHRWRQFAKWCGPPHTPTRTDTDIDSGTRKKRNPFCISYFQHTTEPLCWINHRTSNHCLKFKYHNSHTRTNSQFFPNTNRT